MCLIKQHALTSTKNWIPPKPRHYLVLTRKVSFTPPSIYTEGNVSSCQQHGKVFSAEVDSVQQRRSSFPCLKSKPDPTVVTLAFIPYTASATCFMLYINLFSQQRMYYFCYKSINTLLFITKEGMVWKLSMQRQTINVLM
jgi:hypothetical protein